MKESSILVISVIIKLHKRVVFIDIFSLNMNKKLITLNTVSCYGLINKFCANKASDNL